MVRILLAQCPMILGSIMVKLLLAQCHIILGSIVVRILLAQCPIILGSIVVRVLLAKCPIILMNIGMEQVGGCDNWHTMALWLPHRRQVVMEAYQWG